MAIGGPGGQARREVVYDPIGPADAGGESAGAADGVRVLLALLDDTDPKVRYFAAQRLGWLEAAAAPALPALRAAVGDGAEVMDGLTVGDAAAETVRRIEAAGAGIRW
jgi:hypothetical protein